MDGRKLSAIHNFSFLPIYIVDKEIRGPKWKSTFLNIFRTHGFKKRLNLEKKKTKPIWHVICMCNLAAFLQLKMVFKENKWLLMIENISPENSINANIAP